MAKRDTKSPSFKLRIFTGDLRQPILGLFIGLFGLMGVLYIFDSHADSISPSITEAKLSASLSNSSVSDKTINWGDSVTIAVNNIGYDREFDARGYSLSIHLVCRDTNQNPLYNSVMPAVSQSSSPVLSTNSTFRLETTNEAPATCTPTLELTGNDDDNSSWVSIWPKPDSSSTSAVNTYSFSVN